MNILLLKRKLLVKRIYNNFIGLEECQKMKMVEKTAKTKEDALAEALRELGVTEDKVII
jgi:hypothetical protein